MIQMPLSEQVVERLQRVATKQHTDIKELLVRAVEFYLAYADEDSTDEEFDAWDQYQRESIDREIQLYIQQHQDLLPRYRGQYIAMVHGKVVDYDADEVALSRRVRTQYGKQPVLITPVLSEPIQTIIIRSPRIVLEPAS